MLVELLREDVRDQSVEEDEDHEQADQASMQRLVAVLLTDQTLSSLGEKPVDDPNEQDEAQRHDFVDVERVAQDSGEQ